MSESATSSSGTTESDDEASSEQSAEASPESAAEQQSDSTSEANPAEPESDDSSTTDEQSSSSESPPKLQERGIKTIPTGRRPFITISQNGSVSLNATARREYCADAVAVQLGMDEENNVMYIQPHSHEPGDRDKYLYSLPGDGNATLSASSWLKHFGLQHEQTRRYKPRWNDELQAIQVDLDQEGEQPGTNQSPDDAAENTQEASPSDDS